MILSARTRTKDKGKLFFKNFSEVRCAHEGYLDKENCRPIMERGEVGGGKKVRLRVQMQKEDINMRRNVEETVSDFLEFLNNLTTEQKNTISSDTLKKLRDALVLVDGMVKAAQSEK